MGYSHNIAPTELAREDGRVRLNLREVAGAFGDLGTALPLLVGMLLASGFDGAHVFFMFGVAQIYSALYYGVPIPAQPLKVVAALTIAQGLAPEVVYGAGVAIGAVMLLLTLTGLVDALARAVPKCVVRGIQFGLGLKLMLVAVRYMGGEGVAGLLLAGGCLALVVLLRDSRRMPPALLIVVAGLAYALLTRGSSILPDGVGLVLPRFQPISPSAMLEGFVLLGIAQLPLSLGNSVLATEQLAHDFYPRRAITARKIGFTYSVMNLVVPFFGGVPVCHGSGGVMGMHLFGGRTGGATLVYGLFFVLIAFAFGGAPATVVALFPVPMLGALLLAESVAMAVLVRDPGPARSDGPIAVAVGLCAVLLPYGFLVGLIAGTTISYAVFHFCKPAVMAVNE